MGEKDLNKNVLDYKNVVMQHSRYETKYREYGGKKNTLFDLPGKLIDPTPVVTTQRNVWKEIEEGLMEKVELYLEDFDELIREHIKRGWTPIGEVQEDNLHYIQTMVMYDTESNRLLMKEKMKEKEITEIRSFLKEVYGPKKSKHIDSISESQVLDMLEKYKKEQAEYEEYRKNNPSVSYGKIKMTQRETEKSQ